MTWAIEIDPRTVALEWIERHPYHAQKMLRCMAEDIINLQAENARLREALRKCAAVITGDAMSKYRITEALELTRASLNPQPAGEKM
jgi:hypothetical protein